MVEESAGVVPALAVLAAAADVGQREHAAQVLHKHQLRDAEGRRDADVEAAVAVQQAGRRAVPHQALLVHDEHGDLGAVLARVEHLVALELGRVEAGHRDLFEHLGTEDPIRRMALTNTNQMVGARGHPHRLENQREMTAAKAINDLDRFVNCQC